MHKKVSAPPLDYIRTKPPQGLTTYYVAVRLFKKDLIYVDSGSR